MTNDVKNIVLRAQQVLDELQNNHIANAKQQALEFLITKPFWWVTKGKEKFLLDVKNKLLWEGDPSTQAMCEDSNQIEKNYIILDVDRWMIPSLQVFVKFSQDSGNPLRTSGTRIKGHFKWYVRDSTNYFAIDSDNGVSSARSNNGYLIYVNEDIAQDLSKFIEFALENKLQISSIDEPDVNLLQNIQQPSFAELYKNLDYNRCRLPKLEQSQFTDPNKGLWELDGLDESILNEHKARVRDPLKDVRDANIGIDFGTSSTVVAYEDINGRAKLLRIGVDDYYEQVLPEHYENPTVLEFLDFQSMLNHWTQTAQQPLVNWDDVRCSHEALHNFRNNGSNPKIVASILSKLKQWALREKSDDPIRLTDQIHSYEHQLAHLSLRNPVKGAALQVSVQDDFDPIELYAWFLGLNINWRGRGLFLKYYMTFPVAYPKDVKEKILASFRRGLLRSLPEALTKQANVMEKFIVEERASEPAAYVAASMKAHNIEPTDEGIAYAVFDFGGGTTDFDFGYYRWATDEENDQAGIEEVFEHFEAAGDKFLGGENLLENMAYLVFRHNLDLCRENKIAFTRPLDAEDFTGSEMLVDKTQAAHTNTLMLMSRLRPFWEKNQKNDKGSESLNLLNREGDKVLCELQIPFNDLSEYLDKRIQQGVKSFFIAMQKAFKDNIPSEIHILLAGNSSRSHRVNKVFMSNDLEKDTRILTDGYDNEIEEYCSDTLLKNIFGANAPNLTIHQPLEADINDESKPTAKTGVALGILRLCPGTEVKVINHALEISGGEAPFAYYVGRARRGKFQVGLARNEQYGEWRELGVVPEEGIFNFYFTQSNLANSNEMTIGHNELYKKTITFPLSCKGQKIYASAKMPASMNIGCSESSNVKNDQSLNALQEIVLG